MNLLVLLLLTLKAPLWVFTTKIKLDQYKTFDVEFESSCPTYFWMYNEQSYQDLYLSHVDDKINLAIITGQSYEIYTTSWSKQIVFGWPNKTINSNPMLKINGSGNLTLPFEFNVTHIYCEVKGLLTASGSLVLQPPLKCEPADYEVYKCQENKDWKFYVLLSATFILAAFLILFLNVSEETILRRKISRFLQWIRKILSRSEENSSECEAEHYSPVFTSRV